MAERLGLSVRKRAHLLVRERPSLAIERLGFSVVEKPYLGIGVLGRTRRGSTVIEIVPHAYPAKREYTLAHELMELALPRKVIAGKPRERVCQRAAASFLLPSIAFKRSLALSGWELPTLVGWWKWASWEALGFRIADIYDWARFVVWTDGKAKVSGGGPPTVNELAAYEAVTRPRAWRELIVLDGQAVTAWRVTEPGVRVKVVSVGVPATAEQVDWWNRNGRRSR